MDKKVFGALAFCILYISTLDIASFYIPAILTRPSILITCAIGILMLIITAPRISPAFANKYISLKTLFVYNLCIYVYLCPAAFVLQIIGLIETAGMLGIVFLLITLPLLFGGILILFFILFSAKKLKLVTRSGLETLSSTHLAKFLLGALPFCFLLLLKSPNFVYTNIGTSFRVSFLAVVASLFAHALYVALTNLQSVKTDLANHKGVLRQLGETVTSYVDTKRDAIDTLITTHAEEQNHLPTVKREFSKKQALLCLVIFAGIFASLLFS